MFTYDEMVQQIVALTRARSGHALAASHDFVCEQMRVYFRVQKLALPIGENGKRELVQCAVIAAIDVREEFRNQGWYSKLLNDLSQNDYQNYLAVENAAREHSEIYKHRDFSVHSDDGFSITWYKPTIKKPREKTREDSSDSWLSGYI